MSYEFFGKEALWLTLSTQNASILVGFWMSVHSHLAPHTSCSTLADIIGIFSKAHVLGKYEILLYLNSCIREDIG